MYEDRGVSGSSWDKKQGWCIVLNVCTWQERVSDRRVWAWITEGLAGQTKKGGFHLTRVASLWNGGHLMLVLIWAGISLFEWFWISMLSLSNVQRTEIKAQWYAVSVGEDSYVLPRSMLKCPVWEMYCKLILLLLPTALLGHTCTPK